jgi:hypothetical protein
MEPTTTDWITAVTAVFAVVGTVGALVFAAKAATAASKSANAANGAIAAAARPLLLDVPYEHYMDYEHEYPWPDGMRKTPMRGLISVDAHYGTFVFPVRNVGRGAARIESYSFTLMETGDEYAQFGGQAVPVGEDIWLAGRPVAGEALSSALLKQPAPVHGSLPFIFTVTYTDIAGQQRQRLELAVGTIGQDSALRVRRIEHVVD